MPNCGQRWAGKGQVPSSAKREGPIGDGEEVRLHANGQEWIVTWHVPNSVPDGRPHGSAGICLTPEGNVVLISSDGTHWDWPAGRPDNCEDWEETLRREIREEACAIVLTSRLLGFSRGHCIRGKEEGLVLVRGIWRADVELQPWKPRFEIRHRRVVQVTDFLSSLTVDEGFLPTYRRALMEAGRNRRTNRPGGRDSRRAPRVSPGNRGVTLDRLSTCGTLGCEGERTRDLRSRKRGSSGF